MRVGQGQTSIARLRFAASGRDTIAARLDLERLLSSSDLQPTLLPPAAILCVRKITTRQPDRSDRFSTSDAWQRSLRASLSEMAARAERMSLANEATGADVVIFADMAELMACLAHDSRTGAVARHWWWRGILKSTDPFWKAWQQNPEYVSAALEHLARARKLFDVVASLSEFEARELTQSVVKSFGLRLLAEIVQHDPRTASSQPQRAASTEKQIGIPSVEGQHEPTPWAAHVPETATMHLSHAQERFLGIALMIRRAPAHVRTRRFARAVERWQERIAVSSRQVDLLGQQTRSLQALATTSRRKLDAKSAMHQPRPLLSFAAPEYSPMADNAESRDGEPDPAITPEQTELDIRQASSDRETKTQARRPAQSTLTNRVSAQPALPPGRQVDALPNVALLEQQSTETVVRDDVSSVISIETDLGGLLYLINLALYLDLYADFTAPLAAGIELNIWDFLALIGSELMDDVSADPIWSLLAKLAGRHEPESPGAYFSPAKEWRLPPEWLLPFTNSGQKWKWSTHRGRLRVQHPEGFMVLDLPLAKDAGKQLRHEIEPYTIAQEVLARAPLHRLVPLRSNVTRRSVRRWLSLFMPYARARLRVALGVQSDDDISTVLCRRHATVRASATHVDVYFGLAELPLAIRVAGLDRDPGWVPAAGRFIAFHFN